MTSIMVIDDESFIVDLYRDILTLKGFEIIATAYDGDEAIDKLRIMKKPPDIIILDHRMPNKSGIATMEEIVDLKIASKILFVSADIMVQKIAMEKGASGFLSKPFRMDDLLEEINKLAP